MDALGAVDALELALSVVVALEGLGLLVVGLQAVTNDVSHAGAKPSFLGYGGFPGSACVSINDEVIHGIPSKTHIVREGDIVKVDVGAYIGGYRGDCAATIPCGEVSDEAKKLIAVTRQSFFEGIKFARVGYRVSDIGAAVQAPPM